MKILLRVVAFTVGGFALLFLGLFAYFWSKEPASSKKPTEAKQAAQIESKPVNLGENGIIRTGVVGGTTKDAYDEVMKSATVKDEEGLKQLIQAGGAIYVDNNTKVKVIDTGMFKKRVRLLDGDHKGAAVWVPTEFVESE